jgi:hypothetical protein
MMTQPGMHYAGVAQTHGINMFSKVFYVVASHSKYTRD